MTSSADDRRCAAAATTWLAKRSARHLDLRDVQIASRHADPRTTNRRLAGTCCSLASSIHAHCPGDRPARPSTVTVVSRRTVSAAVLVLVLATGWLASACTGATNPTTPPSPWWAFVQPPGATQTSAYHGALGSWLTSVSAPAITVTSAPAASWLATSRRRPDGTTRALACWPVGHPGVHRARLGPRDFRANLGALPDLRGEYVGQACLIAAAPWLDPKPRCSPSCRHW